MWIIKAVRGNSFWYWGLKKKWLSPRCNVSENVATYSRKQTAELRKELLESESTGMKLTVVAFKQEFNQ
jgi:hypothetical protein